MINRRLLFALYSIVGCVSVTLALLAVTGPEFDLGLMLASWVGVFGLMGLTHILHTTPDDDCDDDCDVEE